MNHVPELSTPETLGEDVKSLIRPSQALEAIRQAAFDAGREGFEPLVTVTTNGERIVHDKPRF